MIEPRITVETLQSPPKPATQSVGMIGSWVAIAFSVLGLFGVAYTSSDVQTWTDIAVQAAPYIITGGGAITAALGRLWAKAPIKGGPADPEVMVKNEIRRSLQEQ